MKRNAISSHTHRNMYNVNDTFAINLAFLASRSLWRIFLKKPVESLRGKKLRKQTKN